jgi:hypothetical protein
MCKPWKVNGAKRKKENIKASDRRRLERDLHDESGINEYEEYGGRCPMTGL